MWWPCLGVVVVLHQRRMERARVRELRAVYYCVFAALMYLHVLRVWNVFLVRRGFLFCFLFSSARLLRLCFNRPNAVLHAFGHIRLSYIHTRVLLHNGARTLAHLFIRHRTACAHITVFIRSVTIRYSTSEELRSHNRSNSTDEAHTANKTKEFFFHFTTRQMF